VSGRTYRVVQWATGNIGMRSLRAVIEHPAYNLVGLHVTNPDKAGRDAGALCGLEPVGVLATRDVDHILALKPDCVLYMPMETNFDDVCRLLAAGVNISTTRGEFHNPALLEAGLRERVEQACKAGGASIHGTGSSPGFITEAMPLLLTSISRRLDGITIDEYADVSSRDSPDMLFRIMGFGAPIADFDESRLSHVRDNFQQSLYLVAEALSLPLDGVETKGELAAARKTTKIAAGVVEAGTVAATRMTVTGMRRGKSLLSFRANWYVSTDIDADWDLGETGWRVQVDGDTPLDVRIRFPVAPERWAAFTPGLTAHRAVNAVPMVCQAPPGIRTTADLPQIIANLAR
jgi:2,4-diaminopentanoate dehydrogenase